MPAATQPLPATGISMWRHVLQFIKTSPITTLVIYCILSVTIRENFPFSNFPMYSNPSAERMYYTISEADGKGLPVATLTGITSPKIGKIYRKKADELSRKIKITPSNFTPDHMQSVGRDILTFLRHEAANKKQTLPDRLQLNRIWIGYLDGKVIETSSVIAKD